MKLSVTVFMVACPSIAFAQTSDYVNYNSGQPTGAEFLTHFGPEGGPTALLYNDRPTGYAGITVTGMPLALARLGYSVTFTNHSGAFAGMIGAAGNWDIVMSNHVNSATSVHDAALSSYVTEGGRAVVADWRIPGGPGQPPQYTFGSPVAPFNYHSMTPVPGGEIEVILGSSPIPLSGMGWGIFDTSVVVGPGGTTELISALGTRAGMTRGFAAEHNNLFFGGFFDDTIGAGAWDPALAQDLYSAIIQITPEPATVLLVLLGIPLIARRRV